jgi:hypothetical protein
MLAHVGGFPVEELVPLVGGTGGVLVARAWLTTWIRDRMGR